jgi:hypothetical protein
MAYLPRLYILSPLQVGILHQIIIHRLTHSFIELLFETYMRTVLQSQDSTPFSIYRSFELIRL